MNQSLVSMVAVCALVAAVGCRKASQSWAEKMAEKAIERESGGKADVDFDGGKVSIKTKDGEVVAMTGGSTTVPADFPKDVFVPNGVKILASYSAPDGRSLTMESKDSPESVISQYEAEMKKQGWTEETRMTTGDAVIRVYKKDDSKRTASILVNKSGKGSQMVLTTGNDAG